MNLALRSIDGQIAHGDTFHNDRHPDLKADFILANPPFNISDWGGERLHDDKRWQYGVPPAGNANFAWVQHIVHHLAPAGVAGFVLANGSMSSNQSGEGAIRKNLIEADLVDCMVALPGQLFYSTQIPACLWFLRTADGEIRGAQARVIGFDDPTANHWLAVNQFSVIDNKHSRRPDVVLFVNGLPLAVLELKNAADENATIWSAFQQLRTYKNEIASLFATNALLVISDGVEARAGTLTAGREWFKPWRTVSGERLADPHLPELQVVIEGVLAPRRFLDLVRDFIVFEDDGSGRLVKKMAGYHQFHAVQVAVGETLRAAELGRAAQVAQDRGRYEAGGRPGGKPGDRRVGVVWHTQGSGKSLTMAFYAGRIIREPAMENPTLVVLTDRNDLDDQLFGTFSRCRTCCASGRCRQNRGPTCASG